MELVQRADWAHAGLFCQTCDAEIGIGEPVVVNEDGEPDEYGGWRDLSTVRHEQCPEVAE